MFGSSLPPVVCRRSCLRYLCLFTYSGVQHILCCILFCFSSLYPMLSVSLDCPLLITPSVFSDVYLQQDNNVFIYIHGIYFDSIRYHNSNVPTPILLICTFFAGANSIISFSFASNNKTWHRMGAASCTIFHTILLLRDIFPRNDSLPICKLLHNFTFLSAQCTIYNNKIEKD
jgi:hypothetical protein